MRSSNRFCTGKSASTPACIVSCATYAGQQTIAAPLGQLADAVRAAALHPPSIIVVGECVTRREAIAWFEKRPLFGRRIGITRPVAQAASAIERVLELGGEPILLPTIEILPPKDWRAVDAMLARLCEFDWLVFTSVNGVESFLGRLWDIGGDARKLGTVQIAAIGPATGRSLRQFGLRPDLVPPAYRAESLADELRPHVSGRRVLWARADRGRDVLPAELIKAVLHWKRWWFIATSIWPPFPRSNSTVSNGVNSIGLRWAVRRLRKVLRSCAPTRHVGNSVSEYVWPASAP